jgi:hypothetical protein
LPAERATGGKRRFSAAPTDPVWTGARRASVRADGRRRSATPRARGPSALDVRIHALGREFLAGGRLTFAERPSRSVLRWRPVSDDKVAPPDNRRVFSGLLMPVRSGFPASTHESDWHGNRLRRVEPGDETPDRTVEKLGSWPFGQRRRRRITDTDSGQPTSWSHLQC